MAIPSIQLISDRCQLLVKGCALSTGLPLKFNKPAQEKCGRDNRITDCLHMTSTVSSG